MPSSASAPDCHCNVPATLRYSQSGSNAGRGYYVCGRGTCSDPALGHGRFFLWQDEASQYRRAVLDKREPRPSAEQMKFLIVKKPSSDSSASQAHPPTPTPSSQQQPHPTQIPAAAAAVGFSQMPPTGLSAAKKHRSESSGAGEPPIAVLVSRIVVHTATAASTQKVAFTLTETPERGLGVVVKLPAYSDALVSLIRRLPNDCTIRKYRPFAKEWVLDPVYAVVLFHLMERAVDVQFAEPATTVKQEQSQQQQQQQSQATTTKSDTDRFLAAIGAAWRHLHPEPKVQSTLTTQRQSSASQPALASRSTSSMNVDDASMVGLKDDLAIAHSMSLDMLTAPDADGGVARAEPAVLLAERSGLPLARIVHATALVEPRGNPKPRNEPFGSQRGGVSGERRAPTLAECDLAIRKYGVAGAHMRLRIGSQPATTVRR